MPNNIDKLADRRTFAEQSPSDKLEATFLDGRPTSQWPSYLDEVAIDIQMGIGIGDTGLDKYNFPEEAGPLYRQGMVASAGEHSDLPSVVEQEVTGESLGHLVYLLNQLSYNIRKSETGLEDIQRAITAVLEKLLTDSHGRVNPRLGGRSNSTADILIQLFSDPAVAEQATDVINRFEETYNQGLLAKLDEPQMMTPLWDHQREALDAWAKNGFRGYADMATATGKTVLGLAAIALQYGGLHPLDGDVDQQTERNRDRKAEVLIVAHNDLILEQWRREFDRHLNIPKDRTQGSDDVELTWGRIHFRTAQALLNHDYIEYNLVVLDEAHHYANGSGWGQLLDSFQNDVLALSGSVDEDKEADSRLRDRLESTIGQEVKHYSITEAQQDGVIPTFDWRVEYVPTGDTGSEFLEITEKAAVRFDRFREKLETGRLDIDTNRRLRTHDDVRRFSHTSEGEHLKRNDDEFKELVTTLFSRRTQRWNQSPRLDVVVDAVQRFSDRKVVILTNNNAQIDQLEELLTACDDIPAKRVFTVYGADSSSEQRDTVDAFDEPGESSVLIGTGDLIGEGVDMEHASVGINMSTGNVNKQLIQRIGRVLRNPDGNKEATFLNLVGIPVAPEAQLPEDDGQALIEDAQQFMAFGDQFDNAPIFATSSETVTEAMDRLLTAGHNRITRLEEDGLYEWPDRDDHRDQLQQLLADIDAHLSAGPEAILEAWSPDEATSRTELEKPNTTANTTEPTATTTTENSGKAAGGVNLTVESPDERPISNAFVTIVSEDETTHGRTDDKGQFTTDMTFAPCTVAIRHPTAGVDVQTFESLAAESRLTIMLPEGRDE
jgi:superfamily II DNA or RNA helicase